MKRLFLLGACMALVAACSDRAATDHTPKLKYTYAVIEPTIIDSDIKASMSTISGAGLDGGSVMVVPVTQVATIDSKPFHMISADDRDSDGLWETLRVCGYLQRTDGKPSGCGTLKQGSNGWKLDTLSSEDMGHINGPLPNQTDAWIGILDRSRTKLLEKAAIRSA